VPGQHCLLAERDPAPLLLGGASIHPAPIVLAHRKRNNLHVNNAGGVESYILHVSQRWRWKGIHPARSYCWQVRWWKGIRHARPSQTLLALERDIPSDFTIFCNKFHIAYWRTEHYGAPCLFSSQSPINWASQTGNGNTLKKRRWQQIFFKKGRVSEKFSASPI
jgi:hypothetical protein